MQSHLYICIKKQQLKFWNNIQQVVQESQNNPLGKLLALGENLNVPY